MEPRQSYAVFVPNHQGFWLAIYGTCCSWLRVFDATLSVFCFPDRNQRVTPRLSSSIFMLDQIGDKICIFGFSRGAYTARALAGMLAKVDIPASSADDPLPFLLGRTPPLRQ